jgi:sugar phosphate isomerase/epimerase
MRECSIYMNFKNDDGFFDSNRAQQYSALIQKLDIKYINTKWNNKLFFQPTEDDIYAVEKIRDFTLENNVTITSFHYYGSIFQHDDPDQKLCRGQMKQSIDLYHILKPQVMVVHPGNLSLGRFAEHKQAYNEALKTFSAEQIHQIIVENLRYFADIAQKKEIRIALENIFDGRFYSRIADLVKLVNDINHPNVGYCYDCGHGNIDKVNHSEAIRLMGEKLFETHLHDNDGTSDSHLPIGFGTVNYIEIIKALNSINYQSTATFEFFRWPTEDRIEGVRNAIELWRALEKIAKEGYNNSNWK